MKKTNLILIASCVITLYGQAQNSYGEIVYGHTNSYLSSGTVTSLNAGFLMAGYSQTASIGADNFFIDRTDMGGAFTGSPQEFQQRYRLYGNASCTGVPPQIVNCVGVSMIETAFTAASPYVMTGGMDHGCFFATYGTTGAVTAQMEYIFPGTVPKPYYTKPLITESVQSPGAYYIVGAFDNYMYLLKVNSVGNIMWQNTFQISSSVTLSPRAILESPYSPFDVTVAGHASPIGTTGTDGFFFQVDTTLTTVSNFNTYDLTSSGTNNNGFTSLKEAQSTTGGNGFILGGYGSANSFSGLAWMLKLDQTGSSSIWSTLISGTTDAAAGKIHAVAERYSSFNGAHEYYGSCAANTGLTVYKLDDNGVPFNVGFAQNDEYVYNNSGATTTWPVDMTYLNNGAANDEGLHLYGNYNNGAAGRHYFVQAYFNGEDGCNISTSIAGYVQPSPGIVAQTASTGPALTACTVFNIVANTTSAYTALCGPVSSITTGSNNKPLGLITSGNTDEGMSVWPNPANDKVKLHFASVKSSVIQVDIINYLGQSIKKMILNASSTGQSTSIELNLEALGLENGVYFVHANTNGVDYKEKLIINK